MNKYKELRVNNKTESGDTMSIRALAKEIHISPSHISEIENEVIKPSLNQIMRYHDYFGVSVDYLVGDDNGIVASNEDIRYAMKKVQKAESDEEILLKQTVELLFGTTVGRAILYQMSEILFGVENKDMAAGDYVKNEKTGELHRITHESIKDLTEQLSNELVVLRDPKYRKATYNELQLISEGLKDNTADTFSKKVTLV